MADFIILQTVAPDYRSKLYEYISSETNSSFKVYAGLTYFEPTVKTNTHIRSLSIITNRFILGKRFLIQFGMWADVLKCKVLVMEVNPRIISNWIILVLRKLFGKKTIVWGHAWPRSGKKSKTNYLRKLMRRLSNSVIVYTKSQMNELKAEEPNLIINVAPNALYYGDEMEPDIKVKKEGINDIIYVGRLTKLKKPLVLLEAFHQSIDNLDKSVMLYFIGDGEEKVVLQDYINKHKLKSRVILAGHIGDYDQLKQYYSKSLFSVSPGYIGLSVTQSLGFGVPMLVSRNENHSPELEAIIEGFNSLFFETDDLNSLKEKITTIFRDKKKWIDKRQEISERCKEQYSINAMGNTFIKLFHNKQ